ncbi:hypothetical protein LCGC14_2471310 [marine sediment metagenome]|uniref:Uncharacterized protein n=1 Tax=marine sediment metagenome TaxID=412755 RepID=A0A0F9BB14_9ZZZZ
MPTEWFRDTNFRAKTLATIGNVQDVLNEYAALGFDLSLRQVHYRLVAQGLWPNTDKAYKNLGNIIRKARDAGMLDWDMIVDRGRKTHWKGTWDDPSDIMYSVVRSFKIDKWAGQDWHVEVMVEKEALEGVLIPVCEELQVRLSPNKGYSSASMMYKIGQRLLGKSEEDKFITIIYLGDHDPSGLDMDEDIENRLELYSDGVIDVVRVALTYDQIEQYQPPPNPTKMKDSRAKAYVQRFGQVSWELDALEPQYIANLITEHVTGERDEEAWAEAVAQQEAERQKIQDIIDQWGEDDDEDDDED